MPTSNDPLWGFSSVRSVSDRDLASDAIDSDETAGRDDELRLGVSEIDVEHDQRVLNVPLERAPDCVVLALLAGPGLVNLSRAIPLGEAFNIQLTGRRISAERAYDIGLIQELAEDRTDLMARAHAVADQICECAPLAVRYIKQVIKVGRNLPVDYAARYADVLNSAIGWTDDAREGPRAFAEKRKPDWEMR